MSRNRLGMVARCAVLSVSLGLGLALAEMPLFAAEAVEKARDRMYNGNIDSAVVELKNALQQDPGDVQARLLLGRLYLQLKKGAAAEKELLRASELGANPVDWSLPI